MKKRTVVIVPDICSEEDFTKLERLHYEAAADQAVIALMTNQGQSIASIKPYQEEYIKLFTELEKYKADFEQKYLIPLENENSVSWEIDFNNRAVIFYENE